MQESGGSEGRGCGLKLGEGPGEGLGAHGGSREDEEGFWGPQALTTENMFARAAPR